MLGELRKRYHVKLLTVRPLEAIPPTMRWLAANELAFDELARAEEARKSLHEVDALVDDYIGNLAEFLKNSLGAGILVDQPWNQDTSDLDHWKNDPRLMNTDDRSAPGPS